MHVQRSELRVGHPTSIIMNFSTNALTTRIHLGHGEHLHFTNGTDYRVLRERCDFP